MWTKLFHAGNSAGTWAVDTFLAARGKHNIIVPNLPAGNYLLRGTPFISRNETATQALNWDPTAEIIALHEADVAYSQNPVRGAQLYMNCVQIRITSSGSLALPGGATFPGDYWVLPTRFFSLLILRSCVGSYTSSTPGIVWNIYDKSTEPKYIHDPGANCVVRAAGGSISA